VRILRRHRPPAVVATPDFRIDLHVHTSRYSPCAEFLAPAEIGAYAARAGLHGVVLTDHDVLWEEEELSALRSQASEVELYRGIECTTNGGHLVIIGLDDAGALFRGIPFEDAVRFAHESGAAVIFAHPFRDGDPGSLPVELVDAVEVASLSFSQGEADAARELALRHGKPVVAASDGHALSRIGWAWTSFARLPADERELARLIRAGECRPVAPHAFPA
jgi:predicted metal-dependent phosphoesterase TrpH